MVKILEPSEPPTKVDFLYYLDEIYGWSQYNSMDFLYDYFYDFLDYNLETFQSIDLSKVIFEEYFNGDWRQGQEISKIVITKRFYQVSLNSTQA